MKSTFEKKLIAGFSVIFLSVIALAYLMQRNNQIHQNAASWIRHTQQVLFVSEEISSIIKDLQNSTRGYVITGDTDFLQPVHERSGLVFAYLDSLKALTADNPSQQRRVDSLYDYLAQKLRLTDSVVNTRASRGFAEAQKIIATKSGLVYMNSVDRVIDTIQEEETRLLKMREQAYADSRSSFQLYFVVHTAALLLIIAIFAFVLFTSLQARRKAEKKLAESKQTLQSIIDNASSFIYLKDKEGKYQLMNKGYLQFINQPHSAIVGKTDFDFFSEEMASSIKAFEQEVMNQKRVIEREETYEYNGTTVHYYSVKFPVFEEGGEIIGTGGVITNITEMIMEQSLQRQKEMTETIVEAQEKLRTEIGKELHDNLQQILASANLMINFSLSNAEMQKTCLQKAKEYILNAIQEVRKLSHTMVAPQFSEKPLTTALEEVVDNINLAGKTDARVCVKAEEEINALPEKIKLALYRIVQEQVSNILKYAGAKEMAIELGIAAKKVCLRIYDNGRGFDPKKHPKGIGLRNIASRAELLGGKQAIISAPGQGCTLQVEIPVA